MKKGFPYIVIAILVFIIIWLTKCSGETITTGIDTLTKVSYVHDTIKVKGKTKIKPVPVVRWIHDTIIDSTGQVIITNTKKYTTNDTFEYKTDSFTAVFYTKIYSASPTITKQVVRKHALFAGPSVGLNLTHISLDGLYEREGKIIYRAGIGVNNKLQPMLSAGIYWQISR